MGFVSFMKTYTNTIANTVEKGFKIEINWKAMRGHTLVRNQLHAISATNSLTQSSSCTNIQSELILRRSTNANSALRVLVANNSWRAMCQINTPMKSHSHADIVTTLVNQQVT